MLDNNSLKNELSTLVAKGYIPKKIADRLEVKLIEKNVKINKQQLHLIVNKIREFINNYNQNNNQFNTNMPLNNQQGITNDTDMHRLVESIEKLEERLNRLEQSDLDGDVTTDNDFSDKDSSNFVTTDDIKIPDRNFSKIKNLQIDQLTLIPNDPESIIILMKWLQYLIDKCGRSNLGNILDYYVDIGWISQDAKITLLDYSNGIKEEKGKDDTNKNITDLPSKDHIQSLIFIQKLKGKEFDKHFIDRIDSEVNRITKKLDNSN